jgi:hypothetical protein
MGKIKEGCRKGDLYVTCNWKQKETTGGGELRTSGEIDFVLKSKKKKLHVF